MLLSRQPAPFYLETVAPKVFMDTRGFEPLTLRAKQVLYQLS